MNFGKLEDTPVDLRILSDVINKDVHKKLKYNENKRVLDEKVEDLEVTNTASNRKMEKVGKKIPHHGHDKYATTHDFNNFSVAVFNERLKKAKLPTNADLANVEQRAIGNNKKK